MDEKQLDFNAPLLSVRRLSTTSVDKDTKDNEKSRLNKRQSLPVKKSDWELEEVTKPAAVPFQWEHIPGRAKDEKGSTPHTPKGPFSNSPKNPPGKKMDLAQTILEEDLERLYGSGSRVRTDFYLENGEEDTYSDAHVTLSPSQSFSWRCSESGLSGIDDFDRKSSRTFCTDPQTRDYMMSRFLPAAKAMVLETPQHVTKKSAPVMEPPKYVKKVYSGELRPLLEKYRSNPVSPYNQTRQDGGNEDEADGSKKKSGKAFGFLPRLCIKKSLCLFNPTPSLKSKPQTQPPTPSGELKRMARTSYSGPLTPTFEKHTSDVYRKRPVFRSREFHGIENHHTGKSNQFNNSSETLLTNGSPATRGSRGGGRSISPYRNEIPRSPFHDGATFLGVPKVIPNVEAKRTSSVDKMGNFSFFQSDDQWSGSVSPVAEKTVYVDSVTKVKSPRNLVSSKTFGPLKPSGETLVKSRLMESSAKNIRNTNSLIAGKMERPKAFGSFDVVPPSDYKSGGYRNQDLKVDQQYEDEVRSLERAIVALNDVDDTVKEDNAERRIIVSGNLQSPLLAPPLPKSPSESWLWRTVTLKNPFPKKQVQRTSTADAKWEIIVKASNVHHDHIRYSEELLPHVSHYSKS